MASAAAPVNGTDAGPGRLIVVLGPSGSGKDTLLSYARGRLDDACGVLFVRRAITRPSHAGSEDHLAMTEAEFDAAQDEGQFSLTWAANGLRYGLPRGLEAHLAVGQVAVVNGSRGAWDAICRVFPGALAVEIRVDPETLARRLAARGRESEEEIRDRLARAAAFNAGFTADLVLDNSDEMTVAGAALVEFIEQMSTQASSRWLSRDR